MQHIRIGVGERNWLFLQVYPFLMMVSGRAPVKLIQLDYIRRTNQFKTH